MKSSNRQTGKAGRQGRTQACNKGQCRIIAGKWRGRLIRFEDAEGLRPTTDRIRETVFNWLQSYVAQSHCLDCFAGSGVLGFEALSRGASDVIFIENNKITADNLSANNQQLNATNAVILRQDALAWLKTVPAGSSEEKPVFDLVFLDPPFHSGLLEKSSALLDSSGCLAEDAIIYVEHAADEDIPFPENWHCFKEKRSGQVVYKLYGKQMQRQIQQDK